jgi:putative phosphoesterase
MPERCTAFPAAVFDVLRDVDLILHAGDLGELWVLDQLSAIGPVVAVHGNDETREAQQMLPYQQMLSVAGQRILLWHSHYADPAQDRVNRGGSWQRILTRQAQRGRQAGAKIVVFGHTHVPMAYRYQETMLVNPGALASGSLFTRQKPQTVALLLIYQDGTTRVAHVDLAAPDRVYVPDIDWEARFEVANSKFELPIVEQALLQAIGELRKQTYEDIAALKNAILPLCHPCWAGEKQHVSRAELLDVLEGDTSIAPADREKVVAILS